MLKTVRTTSAWQVGALVLLALAAAGLIGVGVTDVLDARNGVTHTREVLSRLRDVQTNVLEGEAAARRYLRTGNDGDASLAAAAERDDGALLEELRRLVSDNPGQQADAARLIRACDESEALNAALIAARDLHGPDAAPTPEDLRREREIARERRSIISRMDEAEYSLLEKRQARLNRSSRFLGISLVAVWALTVVVVVWGNRVINRVGAARQRAEEALRIANSDLEERVRSRTAEVEKAAASLRQSERRYRDLVEALPEAILVEHAGSVLYSNLRGALMLGGRSKDDLLGRSVASLVSPPWREQAGARARALLDGGEPVAAQEETWLRLDGTELGVEVSATRCTLDGRECIQTLVRDVTERRSAQEEIRRINAELEDRVQVRTAELRAANQELEAFCYSVSHDLRAPLRAIDGFSRMILSDHGTALNTEGQRLLGVVRSNTVRMGELIDDLLSFSRLSRQSAKSIPIDTTALVKDVADSLLAAENGRKIELHIGDLPHCQGDYAMLRQVWSNLILNALKFTRQKEPGVIDIGGRSENGEVTFHVRDNGVGFDMQYADKLFGVFQRFHRREEFEGTGVGLAIVKRVIERHGGRVWADAAVDAGATFWFALPRSER